MVQRISLKQDGGNEGPSYWDGAFSSNDVPEPIDPKLYLQLLGYGFYLNVISKLIGEEGAARLLREKRVQGDPAGESRGGSPTARGKRVPGAVINV
ncbi:hypothetical protein [Peribacillus sp. NPDC096448]|uniref:hypothetical protein n=1 Tax=Peribacillus sp. NPDC096448 TaxID=3364395 RepID=UPI003818B745